MKKSNFIKRRAQRISIYLTHLPLFAKYLTVMTILMIVSYLVLASSLSVLLSNRWAKETQNNLSDSVKQCAEYSERLLEKCTTREEVNNALIIISNNIGVTASAVDTDVFFCNQEGKVLICREDFLYEFSPNSKGCLIHSGYLIPKNIMQEVEHGKYTSVDEVPGLFTEDTFFVGYPVYVQGHFIGGVFASTPIQPKLKEYVSNMGGVFLTSALFASAFSFIVVYAFTAKMTSPMRQMSAATKAYAQGDFSKRVKVRGSDEVAELCRSFNQMATALSVLESSRRSFVANVSHELKTPMTTIGGFIDGMLDGTIP